MDAPNNGLFWKVFHNLGAKNHTRIYRLTGGRIGGKGFGVSIVLLDTVGRKSGKTRTIPLLYLDDAPNVVIVASKGGVDKHPVWYLNLKANPDAEIQIGSERRKVRAREANESERTTLWPRLLEIYPTYADYQARTERKIPLMILEPAA